MILIIGGAYQGKLDYAQATYDLRAGDMYQCTGSEIDFSKRCIYAIEEFVWEYDGEDPRDYFRSHREQWQNSILICRDLSCGVVPMGAENRAWRQKTGRLCQYLAREAEQVIRIFCGLEQRLK